ncbi:MAG TPA: pectate lyase [Pirellulales bacterium]|nr:pectate lyase [Pirellulales bacterium]
MHVHVFQLAAIGIFTALPAFPGAEGCGADTAGGRGGRVLFVTNLDDYNPKSKKSKPIEGSLRAAVTAEVPRTVVFRVSGLIELETTLTISSPFLTIAGQTAPGDGICLKNFGTVVTTHDVVIRHMRFRPGDCMGKELDALDVYGGRNVIFDHCSASWSVDETLSITGGGCTNVTVQWCMITESLNRSKHAKGEHGYGSLIRTDGDITFHHNLYAHHKTRCPRPGTYGSDRGIMLDFRNNVIYDWDRVAGYTSDDKATLNYVGNILKVGPSTTKKDWKAFRIGGPATRMFVDDNWTVMQNSRGDRAISHHGWDLIDKYEPENQLAEPLKLPEVHLGSLNLMEEVLAKAGATLPQRDSVDARIAQEVASGTGRIIDSQDDVGGWPAYGAADLPADADNDGMPDAWERQHGLNPTDPDDHALDADSDGYTNLEEYLNSTDRSRP